jgi:SnoaL-like domain
MKYKYSAPIALALMLLTGLVLGQLAGLSSPVPAALPDSDPGAVQAAERFYDAVNILLGSGDPSNLRSLLHPDFIDHAETGKASGTAGDLERRLLAIRGLLPGLRIQTFAMTHGGDLIASTLIATGSAQGTVNGVAVEASLAGPGLDLLRVANGLVLERCASPGLPVPPHIETLGSVEVGRQSSARALNFERIVFERSSSRTLSRH